MTISNTIEKTNEGLTYSEIKEILLNDFGMEKTKYGFSKDGGFYVEILDSARAVNVGGEYLKADWNGINRLTQDIKIIRYYNVKVYIVGHDDSEFRAIKATKKESIDNLFKRAGLEAKKAEPVKLRCVDGSGETFWIERTDYETALEAAQIRGAYEVEEV